MLEFMRKELRESRAPSWACQEPRITEFLTQKLTLTETVLVRGLVKFVSALA